MFSPAKLWPLVFSAFLAAWPHTVRAEDPAVAKSPPPEWVKAIELPAIEDGPSTSQQDGIMCLLVDNQVHTGLGESYFRAASQVLTPRGVEQGSHLSISYNPAYQSLTLHHLMIRRKDTISDRVDTQTVRVMQREQNLERLQYDGRFSAEILLDDIQVGDIIDYSYTVRGVNPVFEGKSAGAFYTEWQIPVARQFFRVVSPKDHSPVFRCHGKEPVPVLSSGDWGEDRSWLLDNTPAKISDGHLPLSYNPWDWIQWSEYKSWDVVASWAGALFDSVGILPPDLAATVEKLKNEPDDCIRAAAALRYVQEHYRYLAISAQENNFRPFPLATTHARGYGDCKEKTAMLCALLKACGIEAWPALVNTSFREQIETMLPSPHDFNHAVVLAHIGKKDYWLDPTLTHQGGTLDRMYFPNLGYALVLRPGEASLTLVPGSNLDAAKIVLAESYRAPDYESPLQLRVETHYHGAEADRMRAFLANSSSEQVGRQWLEYYTRRMPGSEIAKPLQITDDLDANVLTSVEEYTIASFWKPVDSKKGFVGGNFYSQVVADSITEPTRIARVMPLGIARPRHIHHNIHIDLPSPGNFPAEKAEIHEPSFDYTFKSELVGKSLFLTHTYQAKADSVAVENVGGYLEKIEQLKKHLNYCVEYPLNPSLVQPPDAGWNISAVTVSVTAALIATGLCFWLLRLNPTRHKQVHYFPDTNEGLGGWLILVGFGLFIRPIPLVLEIVKTPVVYQSSFWNTVSDPSSPLYHPFWIPYLYFSAVWNPLLLIYSILLLYLFFSKKRLFPTMMIILLTAGALMACFELAVSYILPHGDKTYSQTCSTNLVRSLVAMSIWIPYMLKSTRVKKTFRR